MLLLFLVIDGIVVAQGGTYLLIYSHKMPTLLIEGESSIYLVTKKSVRKKEMILWQQSLCLRMLT